MKKYFLTGLATLLPLAVTVYVVLFVVNLLTHPFVGFVTQLLMRIPVAIPFMTADVIHTISQILVLVALFVFTLILGVLARWFLFNALVKLGDSLLHKIPLVNKVYKTTKEIIQTLFSGEKNSFKQVVMVPFPYKGCYCLGLVTREAPRTCSQSQGVEMVSVFIPTTPTPTSGFLLMSPQSDLIELKMKPEQAIKYIVSCGVIHPE